MNPFEQKMYKKGGPSSEQLPSLSASELKARREALEEREVNRKKEAVERAEAERVRRLWHAEEAKKAGPHVITEKETEEAKN